jgi:cell division protein FtsL
VFGVVSLNALAAEAAFDAQRLERDVTELAVRYDELTAEVTVLESPDRVQQIAVDELGMVPVEEPGYLLVEQEPPPATDVALRDDPLVPTLGLQ